MYGMVSKKTTETGIIADGSLPTRGFHLVSMVFTWSLSAQLKPIENCSDGTDELNSKAC